MVTLMSEPRSNQESASPAQTATAEFSDAHEGHCFVVMPFGRDREEKRWFRGWYEVVIEPAVASCDYRPILSAAEEQPGAINDEIRSHLVFDPMVVVDLGGTGPADPPNPNVMYELGIRHAFGLPLVIMAWEEQLLPFDVSYQRAIMTARGLLDIEPTKRKLISFIRSAEQGRFYNPMETVRREASLDMTSQVLGEESLLGALTQEIRELRSTITGPSKRLNQRVPKIRTAMSKGMKSDLWAMAQEYGFDSASWGKFLHEKITADMAAEMRGWTLRQWEGYLAEAQPGTTVNSGMEEGRTEISEEFIETVAQNLPQQPWNKGVHKEIAERMSISATRVNRAIRELIRRGRFHDQIEGDLVCLDEVSTDLSTNADESEKHS